VNGRHQVLDAGKFSSLQKNNQGEDGLLNHPTWHMGQTSERPVLESWSHNSKQQRKLSRRYCNMQL
jgi:hypothetical protein